MSVSIYYDTHINEHECAKRHTQACEHVRSLLIDVELRLRLRLLVLDISLHKRHGRLRGAQALVARHAMHVLEHRVGVLLDQPLAKFHVSERESEVQRRLALSVLSVEVRSAVEQHLAELLLVVLHDLAYAST